MINSYTSKLLAFYLVIGVGLMPMRATAEDIDIFTGGSAGAKANPNILIVIDNTSNWSRQSQQWPGGIAQGQSEANAIKTVVNALGTKGANVNIGLMEFATNGTANDQGGFIRYAVRPMDPTIVSGTSNVIDFSTKLNTIYTNISSPSEKRSANTPYGDLMYDVYNYYAGAGVSNDGSNQCAVLNPPNNDTDAGGYTTNYSQFKSPASATASCARNFVIFIGNPNTNGPASDSTANSCELYKLANGTTTCPAGNFSPQLGLPNFSSVGSNVYTPLGQTDKCYTSAQVGSFNTAIDTCVAGGAASCYSSTVSSNYLTSTSTANISATACSTYTQDCNIGAVATTNYPMACGAGTQSYNVMQTGTVVTGPTTQTAVVTSVKSSVCYATPAAASAGVAAGDRGDSSIVGNTNAPLTCPNASQNISTVGTTTTITDTTHSCTYAAGIDYASCGLPDIVTSSPTTACYSAAPTPVTPAISSSITTTTTLTCPAGYTCSYADIGKGATACTGTPSAQTGVTAYLAAAPAPTSPAASSSVATTPALTCDSGYLCTYSAVVKTTATGGTLTYNTTGYYDNTVTPAITSPASSSSLATTTTLTCPANNVCTYAVGTANTHVASVGTNYSASNKESSCTPSAAVLTGTYTYTNNTAVAVNNPSPFTDTAGVSHTWTSGTKCGAYNICVISNTAAAASACTGGSHWALTQTATGMSTYPVTQTATPMSTYTITQTPIDNYTYTIQQTAKAAGPKDYWVTQTDTPSIMVTTKATTSLGQSSLCYGSQPTYTWSGTSDYSSQCTGSGVSCAYGTTTAATTSYCGVGTNQYTMQGNNLVLAQSPNGTFTTDNAVYNADEWAKLLFQQGVPVPGGDKQTVATYTIDVYNKQPNNAETGLYMSMAKNGGGKYYAATNESAIATALAKILAEIQSVNSTFASASLPVNSTNRAQNANQVFIGMFRPDPGAAPRWFGNLKQYQIGVSNTTGLVDLYDNDSPSKLAINSQTGFLDDCAKSFWTKDSPTIATAALPWANNVYNTDTYYWNNIIQLGTSPSSKCVTASTYSASNYSDIPDGAFVEKGAVAEVLRKGNDPASATPTWSFNRNMYTLDSSNALVVYASTNSGLGANAFHFTQGKDVDGDCAATTTPCAHTAYSDPAFWTSSTNIMRPSVHGDVVHSRPLPINYGTASNANAGVTAYYGANDGTFRAVIATGTNAGKELWAFTAPEFSNSLASRSPTSSTDPLTRLMNNTPLVNYSNVDPALNPLPKDYFFDGSTGVYQNIDNSKVWIYPSMRRGGRMIYGFDVTNSNPSSTTTTPVAFKWRAGCPNLDPANSTGCSAGMSGIGQTWSTPTPVLADGYSVTAPLVVVGGGYDSCEDADTASPTCAGGKGHAVYVLDADTGAVIRTFATLRSVVADVSFIDTDNDNFVDTGYVLDTGGNVYRINFTDPTNSNALLNKDQWTIQRIAYTSGGGRKFQWTPALLPSSGKVYLAFASGDREHPLIGNYPYTTPVTNRLYVYIDDMTYSTVDVITGGTNLDDTSKMSDFSTLTTCDTPGLGSSTNTNKGWFMNFPNRGEQAVTSAIIAGGMVTVSTNRPIPPASGTCSTALGEARGYWVNLFNASGAMNLTNITANCGGDRSGIFAGGGLPPSPVIGTVPIGGVPTTVLIGAIQRQGGSSSPIAPQKIRPTIPSIRKPHYWKNSGDN